MEAGNWIALAGILVSGLVAVVGLYYANKRQRDQLEREDAIREDEHRRQLERDAWRREDVPQIEFDIECRQVGFQQGQFIVEFLLVLNNRGNVLHEVDSINLRVRAINRGDRPAYWSESPFRLEFPHPLFETEAIPKKYKFIFVEPHVRQCVAFTTKIDGDVGFIAARAEFSYGKKRGGSRGRRHSVERVFGLSREV